MEALVAAIPPAPRSAAISTTMRGQVKPFGNISGSAGGAAPSNGQRRVPGDGGGPSISWRYNSSRLQPAAIAWLGAPLNITRPAFHKRSCCWTKKHPHHCRSGKLASRTVKNPNDSHVPRRGSAPLLSVLPDLFRARACVRCPRAKPVSGRVWRTIQRVQQSATFDVFHR